MIIIFSGYNNRAVISFLRTLEKCCLDYKIIASGLKDPIWHSRYNKNIAYIRKKQELEVEEIVQAIYNINPEGEKCFIAPSTEYLNRFLLNNREIFEKNNCIIPLVDKNIYELVSDKKRFSDLCEEYKIYSPKEISTIEKFDKPLIAKPKYYVSSDGGIYAPQFLLDERAYADFIEKHNAEDFVFQEFLPGGISYYLLFYFSRNGKVYAFSQQNLAQQPGGKSILAAVSSEWHLDKKIVAPYINMFKQIDFFGMVMVEIRNYENNNYMIEANPRFWGPSQLFFDAKYNFFEFLLNDYGILKPCPEEKALRTPTFYFWSGGTKEEILADNDCVWHQGGKEFFERHHDDFNKADIYKRNDTMNIYKMEELKKLYTKNSKHSDYQKLADSVMNLLGTSSFVVKSHQEAERLQYAKSKLNFYNKKVLDIGGNTGYFTFQILDEGAAKVYYCEGNKTHAKFVSIAAELLNLNKKIDVRSEYFDFDHVTKNYDIILNLNVLHHMGDDFGIENNVDTAKKDIIEKINSLAYHTEYMVLQIGFNWMGDIAKPLFKTGSKGEMIGFLSDGCNKFWDMEAIGIAVKDHEDNIVYQDLNEENVQRDDRIGEFLNRPLFIMKSKVFDKKF